MKFLSYKELPTFLKTEEDELIAIHGYIMQAQQEASEVLKTALAEEFLHFTFEKVIDLKGRAWFKKTIAELNEKMSCEIWS